MTEEEIVDAEKNGYSARLARALREESSRLETATAEAAKWKSAAEYAARREQDLEEAHDYAQKVYENFLEDLFPGEEDKTWAKGCTSRKIVEMIRTKIERLKAEAEGNYKAAKYAQGRVDELLKTNESLELQVESFRPVVEAALALYQVERVQGDVEGAQEYEEYLLKAVEEYKTKKPTDRLTGTAPRCAACGAVAYLVYPGVTENRLDACTCPHHEKAPHLTSCRCCSGKVNDS